MTIHSNLYRALVLIAALILSAMPALGESAIVNCPELTVMESSSMESGTLATLEEGAEVEIISVLGGWAEISCGDVTGYAPSAFLSAATTTSSRIKAYAVKNAPAYKSASTSSKKLGTVKKGTLVYVVGKSGSFYKVQNSSGSITGYMATSSLSQSKPSSSSSSSSSSSKAETLIAVAKKQLGKPYVLGTGGSSSFDCSSFTQYCYKQIGISLSRSAESQGYNYGTKVSKSELKAGDLVCFDTEEDGDLSDHVGIYLGSGKFIHASSAAGKVVISSLSSGYYSQAFSWGRRLIK